MLQHLATHPIQPIWGTPVNIEESVRAVYNSQGDASPKSVNASHEKVNQSVKTRRIVTPDSTPVNAKACPECYKTVFDAQKNPHFKMVHFLCPGCKQFKNVADIRQPLSSDSNVSNTSISESEPLAQVYVSLRNARFDFVKRILRNKSCPVTTSHPSILGGRNPEASVGATIHVTLSNINRQPRRRGLVSKIEELINNVHSQNKDYGFLLLKLTFENTQSVHSNVIFFDYVDKLDMKCYLFEPHGSDIRDPNHPTNITSIYPADAFARFPRFVEYAIQMAADRIKIELPRGFFIPPSQYGIPQVFGQSISQDTWSSMWTIAFVRESVRTSPQRFVESVMYAQHTDTMNQFSRELLSQVYTMLVKDDCFT
jgi:hypothetical protein